MGVSARTRTTVSEVQIFGMGSMKLPCQICQIEKCVPNGRVSAKLPTNLATTYYVSYRKQFCSFTW